MARRDTPQHEQTVSEIKSYHILVFSGSNCPDQYNTVHGLDDSVAFGMGGAIGILATDMGEWAAAASGDPSRKLSRNTARAGLRSSQVGDKCGCRGHNFGTGAA